MIWAKREFKFADYAPYQDRFADLHLKLRGPEDMMMVLADTDKGRGLRDVFISLPSAEYLSLFDGFQVIDESELAKRVDYMDQRDFEKRFKIPTR